MLNVVIARDKELDLVTYTFDGEIEYDNLRAEIDGYYKGILTKYTVWDFSKTKLRISSEEVRKISDQVRVAGVARKDGFDAIVVPGLLHYGLARMYTAYVEFVNDTTEGLKSGVFHSKEEAFKTIQNLAGGFKVKLI